MSKTKIIRTVKKTRRKPRQHVRHAHTRNGKLVKQTTVNKGVKYKPKPKTTNKKTTKPKAKPKKQVKKVEKDEAKEEFNEMLHQQIMENNKELRETVKKLYMVEKDEDRLQEKLLKIEEEIIDNEDYAKKIATPEGKNAFYKMRVGQRPAQGGAPFTQREAEEMRKRSIEASKETAKKYHEKAFPLRKKLLERKKQTNTLQGQRNGLKAHLAYLQSYKASVKKEKEDWVSKSEGDRHTVEDITLF